MLQHFCINLQFCTFLGLSTSPVTMQTDRKVKIIVKSRLIGGNRLYGGKSYNNRVARTNEMSIASFLIMVL